MNDINYDNLRGGGALLTTNAPQAQAVGMPSLGQMPGVGGLPDLSFFAAMAQRRMAEERAQRRAEEQRRQQAFDMQMQNQGDEAQRRARMGDLDLDARRSAEARTQYQDQLARSGPPLRMQGQGPNQTPGYGIDTTLQNAYQREMYMPDGAGIANSGTHVPTGSITPVVPGVIPQPEEDPFDYTARTQSGMGGYRGNRITGIGQR